MRSSSNQRNPLNPVEEGKTSVEMIGTLEKIIFQKPENGFMIAVFLEEQAPATIIIKGTLVGVTEKETVQIRGHWEDHKKYGKQFAVIEAMPVLPNSRLGMIRFLSSGLFKGIGEKTAEAIVKKFGDETFEVIDESPEKLLKVSKVNEQKLESLKESWAEHSTIRDVLAFLQGVGVSQAYSLRIYKTFGLNAVPLVRQNPFQLTEVQGIGFRKADEVASNLGIPKDSIFRLAAALVYQLEQLSQQGHTCYPRHELLALTARQLEVGVDQLEAPLSQLLQERKVIQKELQAGSLPQGRYCALAKFHYTDLAVAERVYHLLYYPPHTEFQEFSLDKVQKIENEMGIRLDPVQMDAVEQALRNKVMIITGGPGTGKTTIIRFILELVRGTIPAVAMAAPTGRAAKRLAEATGKNASTIHRLLEAGAEGFQRNQDRPLEEELLIIDESSMIDIVLMKNLLDAIREDARLILVGDVDQLPSIGPGTLLRNLIESNLVPVVRLETIFRQEQQSQITLNAHRVRKGLLPQNPTDPANELQDFYFLHVSDPERIVEKVIAMTTERIPQRFGFDPKLEVQVLTPMHRGPTGSISLNQALQEALNPGTQVLQHKEQSFRIGDKVIQQQNDYERHVFNGDVGEITEIDFKARQLRVGFETEVVEYEAEQLDHLHLAYAITVHKSQGSEYPAVILPLTMNHAVMLQRNLLYTAITRGKKLVVLIGHEAALKRAVDNVSQSIRFTGLLDELLQLQNDADQGLLFT